ncbi:MAG TPA: YqeG family HAD IIIA-type phosphatase [Candidatus Aquicultor sp.]
MLKKLYPDQYFESIYRIDLAHLKSHGIKGLILDLDNTIIARNSLVATEELKTWLQTIKNEGFKACIVSNNWKQRVSTIAEQIGLPLVARATKPRKAAFRRAMEALGTTISDTVVIGDQIFTDIFGGNRVGLRTILVVPVSNHEAFHTRFLRRLESRVIKRWNDHIGNLMEQEGTVRPDRQGVG